MVELAEPIEQIRDLYRVPKPSEGIQIASFDSNTQASFDQPLFVPEGGQGIDSVPKQQDADAASSTAGHQRT